VGKASRSKGSRREREVVNLLRSWGMRAERVPLSGAAQYKDGEDVDWYVPGRDAPLVCEVKGRAAPAPWQTVKNWLGDNDALWLIEDREDWLVVLPLRVLRELVTR
jgi:hypothetical protein